MNKSEKIALDEISELRKRLLKVKNGACSRLITFEPYKAIYSISFRKKNGIEFFQAERQDLQSAFLVKLNSVLFTPEELLKIFLTAIESSEKLD
jgi:hypothetical protein